LRGEPAAAEEAYREASRSGGEPQPGLALLRAAQGRLDAACAAIRRVVSADDDALRRARLIPAYVEIMLAAGELGDARAASDALGEIAARFDTDALHAMASHARGAVALADGDARGALGWLRRALDGWLRVEAPYEAARTRVLIGAACRALGDVEAGDLELDAAGREFERLEAAPDLAGLAARRRPAASKDATGGAPRDLLTPRERQVLRLIAEGRTNRAIAAELRVSERTVDRHVSNILGRLDVPTRAAATARAYERGLL